MRYYLGKLFIFIALLQENIDCFAINFYLDKYLRINWDGTILFN